MRTCVVLGLTLSIVLMVSAGVGATQDATYPRSTPDAPHTRDATPRRQVTIGASGDLLVHLRVIASARRAGGAWDHVLGALTSIITPEEIAFANLETPLATQRPMISAATPILGAPPEVAAALARAGIDVVSVANNHAYDQWASGMASTIATLRARDIGAVGAGVDAPAAFAPLVIERDGARVAFVALTERVNSGPGAAEPATVIAQWTDDAQIASALHRAREGADVVVVSIHWSHDFWERPTPRQRQRAAFLVEHGADLILGHGPHVLHRVERLSSPRGEALCAYSLGNLLSNQGMRYRAGRADYPGAHRATYLPGTRDGVWLRTAVELEGGRMRFARIEGVPLFTFNNYIARLTRTARDEDVHVQRLRDVVDETLRTERRTAIQAALGELVTLID